MGRLLRWMRSLIRELRRRQVIRVAVVYATTGFVLLQLAEILVDPFGLGPWALRLITLALVLGFPLAIGLAWAYNLTDEGVVPAGEEVAAGEEETLEPGSGGPVVAPNGLIAGLLVVAIGLLLYPRLFSSGETGGQASSVPADTAQVDERSLAVLPFEPLSSGEESTTFARGVHGDLLTRLANISALEVISRTGVRQYRDAKLTTAEIADSLGVRWVLEGGVQKAGDQIQVRAQLIDPRTDAHVWAEDYQRRLTAQNLFAIQGDITGKIAGALEAQLTAGEQNRIAGAPTENLEAYRLYVKGRSQLDARTEEGLRRAVEYFQQALTEDSTYALAWSGLADAIGLFPLYASDPLDALEAGHEEAARRALTLDPDLAEAHASMGKVHMDQLNGPAALRHLRRSLDLKPSYAQAHHWLGFLHLSTGRPKKARRHARRAVELNPQNWGANGVLTWAYIANSQTKEALTQHRKLQRLPAQPIVHSTQDIRTLRDVGRLEEAHKAAKQALSEAGTAAQALRFEVALTEAAMGNASQASRLLAFSREKNASPFWLGTAHAALGKTEAAFETFENMEEWSLATVVFFRYLYSGALGPLREDPRYEKIIREINRHWGLNADGSVPEETEMATDLQSDA